MNSERPAATLNANETLHVVINLDGQNAISDLSGYHYMRDAISAAFGQTDWPGELEFHRWPQNDLDDAQRLEVFVRQWRSEPPMEVVARISAIARNGEQRSDLGIAQARISGIAASNDQMTELYKKAAQQAVLKLYPDIAALAGIPAKGVAPEETAGR